MTSSNNYDINSIVGSAFSSSMAYVTATEIDAATKFIAASCAIIAAITTIIYNIKKIRRLK